MDLSEKTENTIFRHPWELSRTDMVLRELDKLKVHGDVLDIGCGDGFFDDELLKKFPNLSSVWGIDIYASKSNHSEKKHSVCTYAELEDKKFDFILMMDVIEHIEDDIAFLKEIQKYLKKDSVVFITVPAFQFLFSLHDEELHHYRRYNFKTLNNSLKGAGYKIDGGGYWSYFYFSLILMRLLTFKKSENLSMWSHSETSLITKIVRLCLNIDFSLLCFLSHIHIHLPGLSLMAITKKEECQNE